MSNILTGIVTSTKMENTVVVNVVRKYRHLRYHKVITRHKRCHAHYENMSIKDGDQVKIEECRPIAKTVRHQVIEQLKTII